MSRDSAYQKAMELSIKEERDYVVYRSELTDYAAMPLDFYDTFSGEMSAIFEMGIRVDNNR